MRHPDGTPMTKKEVIIMRRGAFKWLPVLCSNDLVHGSWWMVWGSLGCAVFAIIPLIEQYISFFAHTTDDTLPQIDFKLTWALLIFSGFFFTLGSLAFVRAFEEPPVRPIFYWYKHCQTDELLGAWLFLVGTVPAVPCKPILSLVTHSFSYTHVHISYIDTLVFFLVNRDLVDLGALSSSGIFVCGTILFVLACYPSEKQHENYVLPVCLRIFGAQMWVVKHLANDWLAGTWFFFWANFIFTVGTFALLLDAVSKGNPKDIFIWLSSASNSTLFMVGSFYFVSGSYPHANQFYYAHERRLTVSNKEEAQHRKKKKPRDPNAIIKGKRRVRKQRPATDLEAGPNDALSPMHGAAAHVYKPVETAAAEEEEL